MTKPNLHSMTAAASTLGWKLGTDWPETFKTDLHTWQKREVTTAASGEVLCVSYEDTSAVKDEDHPAGEWLVVYND